MALMIPCYHQRFFDNTGRPLAGGSLTFLIASSLSPKNVFIDYAGAYPVTSLTLDATGLAPEYFMDNGLYDIVIKDLNGKQIDKKINIAGISGSGASGNSGLILVSSSDTTLDYISNKMENSNSITWVTDNSGTLLKGTVNEEFVTSLADHLVKADGYDGSPGTLQAKLTDLNGTVFSTNSNEQLVLPFISAVSGTAINKPYDIWFNNASGQLINSDSFSIGGPNNPEGMFVPSLVASGSITVGTNTWNTTTLAINNISNGLQGSINLQGTNNIVFYAHGSSGLLASTWTDLLHVDNLTSGRVPYSNMSGSDDKPYLKDSANFTYINDQLTLNGTNGLILSYLAGSPGILGIDTFGHVGVVSQANQVSFDGTDNAQYIGTMLQGGTGVTLTKTNVGGYDYISFSINTSGLIPSQPATQIVLGTGTGLGSSANLISHGTDLIATSAITAGTAQINTSGVVLGSGSWFGNVGNNSGSVLKGVLSFADGTSIYTGATAHNYLQVNGVNMLACDTASVAYSGVLRAATPNTITVGGTYDITTSSNIIEIGTSGITLNIPNTVRAVGAEFTVMVASISATLTFSSPVGVFRAASPLTSPYTLVAGNIYKIICLNPTQWFLGVIS